MKLITMKAPTAIERTKLSDLTGKAVAIDASMAMYQYLMGGEQTWTTDPNKFLNRGKSLNVQSVSD